MLYSPRSKSLTDLECWSYDFEKIITGAWLRMRRYSFPASNDFPGSVDKSCGCSTIVVPRFKSPERPIKKEMLAKCGLMKVRKKAYLDL